MPRLFHAGSSAAFYQPAVNLGSIDPIVAASSSRVCVAVAPSFSSSLHLNNDISGGGPPPPAAGESGDIRHADGRRQKPIIASSLLRGKTAAASEVEQR